MQKQDTQSTILDYIRQQGNVRPTELLDVIPIGEAMLYRHLSSLVSDKLIKKIGKSPKTFYTVATQSLPPSDITNIQKGTLQLIEENFLHVTPTGKRLEGVEAFIYWCNKRDFDISNMALQYKEVIGKYSKIRATGLLDATSKMRRTFKGLPGGLCIDAVFYVDFYSLETFGKTKLGQMLLYAKQSQDKKAIRQIAEMVKPKIEDLIKTKKIDAVAYVPPTVKRSVQFMKVLEKHLTLTLPKVEVLKVLGDVAVPQKTLKNLEDRVENANASFIIEKFSSTTPQYSRVLVIDDAVGSGASLNQIACKLKRGRIAKKVLGVAITGSLNNFDVISEV